MNFDIIIIVTLMNMVWASAFVVVLKKNKREKELEILEIKDPKVPKQLDL